MKLFYDYIVYFEESLSLIFLVFLIIYILGVFNFFFENKIKNKN